MSGDRYVRSDEPRSVETDAMTARDWESVRVALLVAADVYAEPIADAAGSQMPHLPNTALRLRQLAGRIEERGAL